MPQAPQEGCWGRMSWKGAEKELPGKSERNRQSLVSGKSTQAASARTVPYQCGEGEEGMKRWLKCTEVKNGKRGQKTSELNMAFRNVCAD